MTDTSSINKIGERSFTSTDVINLQLPVIHSTIDSLVKLPRPIINENRTQPETRIYTIEGKITFWTIEPDRDIHIAIRSDNAKMICEIPHASKAKNSIVLDQIKIARNDFF